MTTVMNKSVRSGLEIIALPRFDLDQTLKLIDKKKPHYFPAVPAIYSAINNHPKLSNYDLTSLRYCISGARRCLLRLKKSLRTRRDVQWSKGTARPILTCCLCQSDRGK